VAARAIGESLAYINWTILAALAAGSFGAVVLLHLRTEATRGFLGFTAACAALLGAGALASDLALPSPGPGLAIVATPEIDTLRRLALAAFVLLAVAEVVAVARRGRSTSVGFAGLSAIGGALLLGAFGWSGGLPRAIPLAIQLLVLSAATGGVLAGMILGHWYLVTPRLPEAPLVLLTRALTAVVALQLVLFAAWTATGTGGGHGAFEPLVGEWALFVWLRLLIGLVFPVVVSWAAVQTARTRSMESATGLLYIDVGAILAGAILAAGLYFGGGLLA
jgi:hypothetical protein